MRPGICIIALAALVLPWISACGKKEPEKSRDGNRLDVVVSIAPQKYFVQRIGGDRVHVIVMVKPEENHETYEPAPRQLAEVSRSRLYFRIGIPFEAALIEKIASANRELKIVDTRQGVPARKIESFSMIRGLLPEDHSGSPKPGGGHGHQGEGDPHIWLDPRFVKIQAYTILKELQALDPGSGGYFQGNHDAFVRDLDAVDAEIARMLAGLKQRKMVVFHPAWGYFTDRYGLLQIPIEFEGKEPGQKELAFIIEFMKKEKIRALFIQKQFNTKSALTIADAVGAQAVPIDHMSMDYLENLKNIARAIRANLE